jgi:hypothetical protein
LLEVKSSLLEVNRNAKYYLRESSKHWVLFLWTLFMANVYELHFLAHTHRNGSEGSARADFNVIIRATF